MSQRPHLRRLPVEDIELILAVTAKLAAPFDLLTMLAEVTNAAKHALRADRTSVWLYDAPADEMVLEIGTGLAPVRIKADTGFVGACARDRRLINVPDCYADPRFNPEVDRASGYRTRCMLTLPLVDHNDALVGAMQVLNKVDGVFDANDEALATVLAAQCAVALQRARMTEALIEGEKLRQELEMARVVQMSTLPATMPAVPGYDCLRACPIRRASPAATRSISPSSTRACWSCSATRPVTASRPALSVTQMQAMLRMALRIGADLETAFVHVNNQLAETMADDRFVTAFIGLLDPAQHRIRFHSGGQAPILHFRARRRSVHAPRSDELSARGDAARFAAARPSCSTCAPGDILALLSDGIYEYRNAAGEQFGESRVEADPARAPRESRCRASPPACSTPSARSRAARRRRTTSPWSW